MEFVAVALITGFLLVVSMNVKQSNLCLFCGTRNGEHDSECPWNRQ